MSPYDAVLKEYALAHVHADDDRDSPTLAIPDDQGTPCTPSMARFRNAENRVLELRGKPGLPAPVKAFLAAVDFSICPSCWVSSNKGRNHPECNRNIERYFNARDNLLAYSSALKIS